MSQASRCVKRNVEMAGKLQISGEYIVYGLIYGLIYGLMYGLRLIHGVIPPGFV